jgi:flagellar protein FlbD
MLPAQSADKEDEKHMIWLTRLNRAPMVLNADLIEHIDVTPDTVITLTTGQILRVRETADEVVQRIVEFRRRIAMPDGNGARLHIMTDPAEGPEQLGQSAADEETVDAN